jgi:hypothetical protein
MGPERYAALRQAHAPVDVSRGHHEALLALRWNRPGLLTCRNTGAMLCPRGDLNPHAR